jgi:hypothetical protein
MAKHRAARRQDDEDERKRRIIALWSRRARMVTGIIGAIMAGSLAFAVTNWVVGVAPGSSGQGQSASITNLTITATATPSATNLLYPGGTGDVVISISNPNPFPVTITAFNLPTNTTYATGYSDSGLTSAQAGCAAATPSYVTWNYSTGVSGTSHTLTSPVTVGASGAANNPLVVTLTNDAAMGSSAPLACANTYFSMPSFTGVTATGGAAASTGTPATSAWTS